MNESNKLTSEEIDTAPELDIAVEVFGRTDVGLVREHNEDNFLVADLTEGNRSIRPEVRNHRVGIKGSIFTVCDGMGGAAAGEVASQIAVDTIYDMMQKGDPATSDECLAQKLEKAVCEAGRRILTAAKMNRAQRGMGTTVTAATLIGPRLLVGQVGDSRAYILRGRQFVQITKDQSLVQQLIDAKQMTEEEAKTFDKNNIILQALGTAEEVHVDVTSVILKRGDRLVMCSDGLCGIVENDIIRDVVSEFPNPLDACRVLTEKACQGGGHDNITVIVAAFDGLSLADPPSPDETDPDLVYERFSFTRASETTARKMRPGKQPAEKRDSLPETTQSFRISESSPSIPPPVKAASGRSSKFAVMGLVAAVCLTIVVVTALRGNQSSPVENAASLPPAAAPPLSPVAPPAAPPAALLPAMTPLPVMTNETAQTAPPPLPTDDAVPQLAPTPEEAITGGAESSKVAAGKSNNSDKSGEKHSSKNDGIAAKMPDDNIPSKEPKVESGVGTKNPDETDSKDTAADGKNSNQEGKKDTVPGGGGGTKEPEDETKKPSPIDKNPFE